MLNIFSFNVKCEKRISIIFIDELMFFKRISLFLCVHFPPNAKWWFDNFSTNDSCQVFAPKKERKTCRKLLLIPKISNSCFHTKINHWNNYFCFASFCIICKSTQTLHSFFLFFVDEMNSFMFLAIYKNYFAIRIEEKRNEKLRIPFLLLAPLYI